MRRVGPLIVILIVFIIGGVGATYYARLKQQNSSAPPKPKSLSPGITTSAQDWTYTQTKDQKPIVSVRAKDMEEVNGKYQLTGVELHLFHKEGNEYDQVKSAKAEFDLNQGVLYSEGEVEITMGVPKDQVPNGRLMVIKSSGVHFESKTGKASTDRMATFQFDRGQGKATGAAYDPNTRELQMSSQVELIWRGADPTSKPMKVETSELHYKERESKVFLGPWSRLTRDTFTLNAGPAVVTLDEGGVIKLVETSAAKGADQRPDRNLEYAADQLALDFDDNGQVKKITGTQNARLVSSAETAVTTIASDRVDMDFDTSGGDSVLRSALASGHSIVDSRPVAKPGSEPPDTRILKSDVIKTAMRAGGREIESVETETPGAIEFIPNRPGQPHRFMNGERIWITYGPKNQIQTFRSVNVSTRTENAKAKDAKQAPALTWSKDLLATFEPNSSQLSKLEQWNDFRYEEGDRKAKAQRAILDQPKNLITLLTGARVSDSSGSADGDKIVLDQKSGDFNAEGNVNSTRMPDKKKDEKNGSGLLSQDEPLHAKANKMSSTDHNLQVRYDGNAFLWQGANRLQADSIEIDRDNDTLKAHGHVISQLLDKAREDEGKNKPATKPGAPVFTVVKAPEMTYNDDDRTAHYKGGVLLNRPNMQVKAQEIRAFLRDDSNDSSLDHAFADGKVEIVQTAPGRTRNGSSEHAEYYVDDDKVILEGGQPVFVDNVRGTTRGNKLTWFSQDDRLLVNGVESQPAKSMLRRKNVPVR